MNPEKRKKTRKAKRQVTRVLPIQTRCEGTTTTEPRWDEMQGATASLYRPDPDGEGGSLYGSGTVIGILDVPMSGFGTFKPELRGKKYLVVDVDDPT